MAPLSSPVASSWPATTELRWRWGSPIDDVLALLGVRSAVEEGAGASLSLTTFGSPTPIPETLRYRSRSSWDATSEVGVDPEGTEPPASADPRAREAPRRANR